LLSSEALDRDSIEKNFDRIIDWFKKAHDLKLEPAFLEVLPDKVNALLANILDQINELDYNATSRLKTTLRRFPEVDLLKPLFEEFNKTNNLSKALDDRFKELVADLKDQSKKIKKVKNLEKRKKFYEAEKAERLSSIQRTNTLFAEDDLAMKRESVKSEIRSASNHPSK